MIDFQEFGEAAMQDLQVPGPTAALAAQALLIYAMRRQDGTIREEVLLRLARDQSPAGRDSAGPDTSTDAARADLGAPSRQSTGSATGVLTLLNTCGVEARIAPRFILGFVRHLQDRLPAILLEEALAAVPELELVAGLDGQAPSRRGDGAADFV